MTSLGFDAAQARSRKDHVLDVLRDAIISGRIAAGDRLTEVQLSSEFGTSRSPVREALRQLEQEGLVETTPYRGTAVLGVSQREIEQVLIPIRITLERFAFAEALAHLEPADFADLQLMVDEMDDAAERGDAQRLADADVRFHELVITRSGQRHCLQIWKTIQPRVHSYFQRDAHAHADASFVARQHQELLRSLQSGDADAVTDAIDQHIHIYLSPATTADD